MKICVLFLSGCILLSGCSNNTGNTSEQQLRTENFRLKQENDSLKRLLAKNDSPVLNTDTLSEIDKPRPANYSRFPGKHALTLQWISWDIPGSVMITEVGGGWYTITGGQTDRKNKDNYVKIKGRIRPLGASELEFDGTIESKIETLNGGEPCIKTGRNIFKATGTRKYWRLQNMENCEGGNVLDYIDIYF